jgi:hypothetical protein
MSGPFATPKAKVTPAPDLTQRVVVDMRAPQSEVDCNIILHLPDRPEQRGTGVKQT